MTSPSWALSGRLDPTAVKQDIERRLEAEELKVAEIDSAMKTSEDITNNMVGILASFEQRLKRLEGTILPVYQETENLQRRQENIDRTIEAMDHVIAFYNVSKEVEPTVAQVRLQSFWVFHQPGLG